MRKVGIIMGSDSDLPVVENAMEKLKAFEVPFEVHVYSAHRTPEQAGEFSRTAREKGFGVLIAAAGKDEQDGRDGQNEADASPHFFLLPYHTNCLIIRIA